jgi:SEFIR domain
LLDESSESQRPKLFVSYSWTDPAHIDWVIQLATDLCNLGVEAIIDRWHLREGQDAHSFMESMVRSGEVNKAILVCDRKYVDRANSREGGVGAESQIVTSTIFADVGQTKFVAVIRESNDDGSPTLPNFLTSRILSILEMMAITPSA